MNIIKKENNLVNSTLVLAAIIIIIAGIRAASPIVIPVLLACFIAIICLVPLQWLRKRKFPTWIAILLIMVIIFLFITAIGGIVGTSMRGFYNDLPLYLEKFYSQYNALEKWLSLRGLDTSAMDIKTIFNPQRILNFFRNSINGIGTFFKNSFLIMLIVLFMLFEASSFPHKLRLILDNPDDSLLRFHYFTKRITQYIAIKTVISMITGILIFLYLLFFNIEYKILWGLLAFVLNFIPTIGSIIASIPPVLLALIMHGPASAVGVTIGYLVVNQLLGSFIEPRIMGHGLGLSTLVVFLSLLFWGWILGPVGMLLSVPLTIMVKMGLEHYQETNWLAILLGGAPIVKKND